MEGANKTILVAVGGMSCGGCEGIVESCISNVDGVKAASAPFMSKKRTIVTVVLDRSTDTNKLLEALKEMDYDGEIIDPMDEDSVRQEMKAFKKAKKVANLKKSAERKAAESKREVFPTKLEEIITQQEPVEPRKSVMSVRGMTCAGCVVTLEKVLLARRGVLKAAVGLLAEKADIYYDPSLVSPDEIRDVINESGSYHATILVDAEHNVLNLSIGGMTCASCTGIIENVVGNINGVKEVSVNLTTNAARVKYDCDLTGARAIIAAIEDVGYSAVLAEEADVSDNIAKKKELEAMRRELQVALLFTVPVFFIGMVFHEIPYLKDIMELRIFQGLPVSHFLLFVLTTPVQFGIGKRFYINAYKILKHGGANMDVLIAIGTSAAYFYSCLAMVLNIADPAPHGATVFFDTSAMLISLTLLGKFMETLAKGKTSEAIQKLMEMQPHTATLVILDENQALVEEKEIEVELVQRGDILKVVPGSRIPADGIVVQGKSSVDESLITGESLPVSKLPDDRVIAGTINQSGLIRMRATKVGGETGLAQIIRLVQDAQTGKAPIQSFADFIASWFVPVVVIIGIGTFVAWLVIAYVGKVPTKLLDMYGSPILVALLFSISVIVIACPCALGLATPTAIMVGTGIGATNGVLIKGGAVLEMAHKITAVIFDKTGTLTYGKPAVTNTELLTDKLSMNDLYRLVGSAEKGSEHPLAQAVCYHAEKTLGLRLDLPEKFESTSGEGIQCVVRGRMVTIGNRGYLVKNLIGVPAEAENAMQMMERDAKTAILVGIDNYLAAVIGIADQVKPEAKITVATLRKMGIQSWMVTGDNQRTANAIAGQVGITNVFAEVLPSLKAKKVKELKSMGHIVAMVGDGINDSPALAESDVGIAIGAGTDIAIEAAGMVLVKSDLRDVVTAIDLSKRTFNRIRMNYVLSMFYNICGIPLAAGILVPFNIAVHPMMAGLAMAFSSVSVVVSSLLLKRYTKPAMATVDPFVFSPLSGRKRSRNLPDDEIELLQNDFLSHAKPV
eukprot:TRINITY_DN1883_c0_g1_i2.p1 TRINITY_DN1883_c0_g1~~TRINITY_DN1883_c0_g1_i2.p1  ORF type:complete len:1016 (+),score=313.48 TRINITY_DN1883_c0_g1_i2:236-3283(+)